MSQIAVYNSGSTPPPGDVVETLTGNSGGAVGPNGSGNINVVGGNNITIIGSPGSNTLTASITGTTNHALQVGNASGSITSLSAATNGQIPIGSNGVDPVVTTLTAGSGINITNGAGSITIEATGGGGGITQLDSDTGVAATDSTIKFEASTVAGASFAFSGQSTNLIQLQSTDAFFNIVLGLNSSAPTSGGSGSNNFIGANSGTIGSGACGGNNSIGTSTFSSLGTGVGNVAIGDGALASLIEGSYNIAIGSSSNISSDGNSNILINNTLNPSENNTLRIGNNTGTADQDLNAAYICGISTITVTGTPVIVASDNQLGIAVSASRFKEDIQDMGHDSAFIYDLRPVTFKWNKRSAPGLKNAPDDRQYGLIAEEVDKIMPSMVVKDTNGDCITVKYQDLTSILLNEIQILKNRIEVLESKEST